MINSVVLFLILTSLLSASVWPVILQQNNPSPSVIVKEGPVEVIVEYDTESEDSKTRISISSKYYWEHKTRSGVEKVEEDVKEGFTKGVDKVKDSYIADTAKRGVEDIVSNVTNYGEKIKESDLVDVPKRARAAEDIWRNVTKVFEFVHSFLTIDKVNEKGEEMATNGVNSNIGLVHLLGFSMAFGMSIWVTFYSCYILNDALPRKQFEMLQSQVYPIYFRIQSYCVGIVLVTHFLIHGRMDFSNRVELLHTINISICVLTSLANLLFLEPYSTKIMLQRLKLEKDAGRERSTSDPTSGIADAAADPVSATTEKQDEIEGEPQTASLHEKINMLNRVSSYTNTITIVSLGLHLVYLGTSIQVT